MIVLDLLVLGLMAYVRLRSYRRIKRMERDIKQIKQILGLDNADQIK